MMKVVQVNRISPQIAKRLFTLKSDILWRVDARCARWKKANLGGYHSSNLGAGQRLAYETLGSAVTIYICGVDVAHAVLHGKS
jgi:hypothetical protein